MVCIVPSDQNQIYPGAEQHDLSGQSPPGGRLVKISLPPARSLCSARVCALLSPQPALGQAACGGVSCTVSVQWVYSTPHLYSFQFANQGESTLEL